MDLPHPISPDIHSYLLGDELVLFSEHAGRLFRLNSSAALIWCCYEEGLTRREIIQEITETFGISSSRAENDLNAALTEWETLGLLASVNIQATDEATQQKKQSATIVNTRPSVIRSGPFLERRYRLHETVFRACFSGTDLEEIAQSVIGHREVTNDQPFDVSLHVQKDPLGLFLLRDGEPIAKGVTAKELGPIIHAQILLATYLRADFLIAMHAAAVSVGDECILLPAISGCGKSTLTAALIVSGYQYCTDELVLLGLGTHTVSAVPVGLGIKKGSWSVLQEFYPSLDKLPIFLRQDGELVRYLSPPINSSNMMMPQHYSVRYIVFPIYQSENETSLAPVSSADALCRITEAGYDASGGLDKDKVEELVEWLSGMSCYELRFHDLREAISKLSKLL